MTMETFSCSSFQLTDSIKFLTVWKTQDSSNLLAPERRKPISPVRLCKSNAVIWTTLVYNNILTIRNTCYG